MLFIGEFNFLGGHYSYNKIIVRPPCFALYQIVLNKVNVCTDDSKIISQTIDSAVSAIVIRYAVLCLTKLSKHEVLEVLGAESMSQVRYLVIKILIWGNVSNRKSDKKGKLTGFIMHCAEIRVQSLPHK